MTTEHASWLQGQIDALRALSEYVASVVLGHDIQASAELESIKYACNRAHARIENLREEAEEIDDAN